MPTPSAVPGNTLSDAWFDKRLAALGPFEDRPALAVGVSGGPDSTALLALCCRWARHRNGRVVALCFDHRLRPASAGEARAVRDLALGLGADAEILTWTTPHPETGVQNAARRARLQALMAACARRGLLHLLLAHHRDDQAETVQMRLSRRSGPDGLAAMPAISVHPAVRLLRPLLDMPKRALLDFCAANGLAYSVDPSNANPRFERARLRQTPLNADDLCRRAGNAGAARADRAGAVSDILSRSLVKLGDGIAILALDRAMTDFETADVALAIAHVVRWAAGSCYLPDIKRIIDALRPDGGSPRGISIAGCVFQPLSKRAAGPGRYAVYRECRASLRKTPVSLPRNQPIAWDGRYRLTARLDGLAVRALGGCDTDRILKTGPTLPFPRRACAALPVIVRSDAPEGILAVAEPLAGPSGLPGPDAGMAEIEFSPAFPLIERGLRLEAGGQRPYIP